MRRLGLVLAAAGSLTGPAASAATPLRISAPAPAHSTVAGATAPLPYERRQVSLPPGVVRTAVERRFSDERLVGQAGFLCGLQDHPVHDGGAGAYGADPDGRFLGASLRLRFR